MRGLTGGFAALALAACASGPTTPPPSPPPPQAWVQEIGVYDRAAWSRTPTDCDARAAHPSDPERVGKGLDQAEIDLPTAIAACHAAVAADPENPRLNYQLARVYGYSGRHAEGAPFRVKALMAGYPQSLFVVGWIAVTGWSGNPKDVCTGAELIRRSALAGRQAGLVGFPHYALEGTFQGCPVRIEPAEMASFLAKAEAQADDFYQRVAIAQLKARLSRAEAR